MKRVVMGIVDTPAQAEITVERLRGLDRQPGHLIRVRLGGAVAADDALDARLRQPCNGAPADPQHPWRLVGQDL